MIGSIDLVQALRLGGIDCAVMARPGAAVRYSRATSAVIDYTGSWFDEEAVVDALMAFGRRQEEPPVLFFDEDRHLACISRHRDRLQEAFRFLLPAADLIEDVVDKQRFRALAERLGLPVPATVRLPAGGAPPALELPYPVIIKPVTHQWEAWRPIAGEAKAVAVRSEAELTALWPRLAASGLDFVAQAMVEGPETRIESYHVYVGSSGDVLGEFTGRKIRTNPAVYGLSSALMTTDDADVARVGRDIIERIGLRGIAKLDFKRDAHDNLHLLEVNCRCNLWHHLGAKAGVNLPALVYADLTGAPVGPARRARPGLRWCHERDLRAARVDGMSAARWLVWAMRSDAKSFLSLDDPRPFVQGRLWQWVRKRVAR